MNIGIVGMGKLGLPVALAIESRGHIVRGFDLNHDISRYIKNRHIPYREELADSYLRNTKIEMTSPYDLIKYSEIIFVAIQTPHDELYEGITRLPETRVDFNYDYLRTGIKGISDVVSAIGEDRVVVIISTVLPGTIRREIKPFLCDHIQLCYNPFFIAMGTTINDFLYPEFILLGRDSIYAEEKVTQFYDTINKNIPICSMSIESAELTKVTYNTFITSKINIANEIMEISDKIPGCNCDDVMGALKKATMRIVSPKYLNPGMGDAGACHPRDNIALSWLARELKLSHDIYGDMMQAREDQTEWLADKVIEYHKESGLPIKILGYTYKKETNLTIGSAAILLMHMLTEKGYRYTRLDPYIDEENIIDEPSLVFIGMNHDVFNSYVYEPGSIILDPWGYIEVKNNVKVVRIGRGNENKVL